MLDRDRVMTCLPGKPALLGGPRRRFAQEGRKAVEIGFAVENELIGFLVGQDVLGELRAEAREAFGDGGKPRLLRLAQLRAGAHEDRVVAVEHARLLGRQAEAFALRRRASRRA